MARPRGSAGRARIPLFTAAALLVAASAGADPAAIHWLGDLPGGLVRSEPFALSDDGSVVVGESYTAAGARPFRWTLAGGVVEITELTSALGVSPDGSVVAGSTGPPVLWEAGVVTELPVPPPYPFPTVGRARATSADGAYVCGEGPNASRWGPAGREPIFPNVGESAIDISADGQVVVGKHADPQAGYGRAYRWVAGQGVTFLGVPSAPPWVLEYSTATDVSPDGEIVVGYGWDPYVPGSGDSVYRAFRWTAVEGNVALALAAPPPYNVRTFADGVTADGATIVGMAFVPGESEAMIWDAAGGVRALYEVLLTEYGLDTSTWELERATGISPDGRFIIGWGKGPHATFEAFLVALPGRCANGLDDDGDGLVDLTDVGCTAPDDPSEQPGCSDGLDNDGDLLFDWPDDPGCFSALNAAEGPQCDDGVDNDADGRIDWDGGGAGEPDANCTGKPWLDRERNVCGLGFELALVLAPLAALRRRRSRADAACGAHRARRGLVTTKTPRTALVSGAS